MDQNLLPPLPSVEELFAPSTSKSSSLPAIKNVQLFIPVPSLQDLSNSDVPATQPKSFSVERSEPLSPVPPQPTSPLVDRLDYQLGGDRASDPTFRNSTTEVASLQELLPGCPRSKKARYSDTTQAASYDSPEEGEISDETDDVQIPTSLCHKPPSTDLTVSHGEHRVRSSSHSQVPTSPSSSHHYRSHPSDTAARTSHHRHHAHPSGKDWSRSGEHQQKLDRVGKTSASHKQPAAHCDVYTDLSKTSGRHHLSSDRPASVKSEKHELHNSGHKGSAHAHRRISTTGTAVAESAKHESHSHHHRHHHRHHHHHSLQSDSLLSKDSSRKSDREPPLTDKLGTTEKDGLETQSSSFTDCAHNRGLSSSVLGSSRLHIPVGSTLGSEIMKNMSRTSVGQRALAATSFGKNIQQSLSHVADSAVSEQNTSQLNQQQMSLSCNKVLDVDANKDMSQSVHNSQPLGHQFDSSVSQSSCHQVREFAAVETMENMTRPPEACERIGNGAGSCKIPQNSVVSSHINTSHLPVAGTELATQQHSFSKSSTLYEQKELDIPYSPGSLDLYDFFEPAIAHNAREDAPKDADHISNIDTVSVECSGLVSNIEPGSANVNVEESVMEIDTVDLVDELPAGVEVEMAAESAGGDGRGQEYEIIDDLDSNAEDVDDEPAASTDNSEFEFDSGEDETAADKQHKSQRTKRTRGQKEAFEQTLNDEELCHDDNGDGDFQAPLVNNKVVLHGESA